MSTAGYAEQYRDIDFREHPEQYVVGKAEQGVLIAEPYKSEILPHWHFRAPQIAEDSAQKIYAMFLHYKRQNDFVGMDIARKFLQMGFSRARRYANHPSGHKYTASGTVSKQASDALTSEKATSARIFYAYYQKARDDPRYKLLKQAHIHP